MRISPELARLAAAGHLANAPRDSSGQLRDRERVAREVQAIMDEAGQELHGVEPVVRRAKGLGCPRCWGVPDERALTCRAGDCVRCSDCGCDYSRKYIMPVAKGAAAREESRNLAKTVQSGEVSFDLGDAGERTVQKAWTTWEDERDSLPAQRSNGIYPYLAYHEAGHAGVALAWGLRVDRIDARFHKTFAKVEFHNQPDEVKCCLLLAGMLAGKIAIGRAQKAEDDFNQIRALVVRPGRGAPWLAKCMERTEKVLRSHWPLVEAMTRELYQRKRIGHITIKRVFASVRKHLPQAPVRK